MQRRVAHRRLARSCQPGVGDPSPVRRRHCPERRIPTNALKMMHRLQHEALGYLLPRLLFLPRLIRNEDYLWNTQVPLKTISYPVTTICESYFHFLCIWIPKWQYNCFLLQMGG